MLVAANGFEPEGRVGGMGDVFGDGKASEKTKEIIGGLLTMNKK